jgi:ribosomal protein S18 acetylase RimI-like enzyme
MYEVRPHVAVPDLARQAYELTRLAFSSYEGVLKPSAAHTAWYLHRPGMDRKLSRAALHGRRMVASLYVTVAMVRLGGQLVRTGVIDTVMTHPDHRRRGLARRLLGEAIEAMRAHGLAVSLLYTVPGSGPYELYRSLGFRPHVEVAYLRRPPLAGPQRRQPAAPVRRAELVAFLNTCFEAHDGYVPLDDDLWRWRREERPAECPALTSTVERDGTLAGSVTFCTGAIVGIGSPCYVLSDLAIAPGVDASETLAALLAAAPGNAPVLALVATGDCREMRALEAAGFARTGSEVAMVLPLSEEGERAVAQPAKRWYVLVESVIGV